MTELHVLNLGAGVQSTTLYLLAKQGLIQNFDAAVFAEPYEIRWIFEHCGILLLPRPERAESLIRPRFHVAIIEDTEKKAHLFQAMGQTIVCVEKKPFVVRVVGQTNVSEPIDIDDSSWHSSMVDAIAEAKAQLDRFSSRFKAE